MAGQAEDGLIVKIQSLLAGSTDKIILAKSPIFVKPPVESDEEEKKGDADEMVIDEIPLQPEEIQMYDFTKKLVLKKEALEDVNGMVVLPTGETAVKLI